MIDTMVFAASLPAGAYTKGQVIPLSLVDGPSVVRDGNGKATLRRVVCITDNGAGITMPLTAHIRNGNWNDEIISPAHLFTAVSFQNGKSVQQGGKYDLVVNSAFSCTVECRAAGTTTAAVDAFVIIEIDYDAIPAVEDPAHEQGMPMSIELKDQTIAYTAPGSVQATGIVWNRQNVDLFKAGYRYVLADIFADNLAGVACLGFVAISGAAGQAGLKRVIPVVMDAGYMPIRLLDAVPMVKGPMQLEIAAFASAAVTADVQLDFIRR